MISCKQNSVKCNRKNILEKDKDTVIVQSEIRDRWGKRIENKNG